MAEAAAPQDERSTGTRQRGFRRAEEKKPSHARRKRPPRRLSQRPNDIYVTRKSDFGAQLARCSKLLDQGCSELYIHGLGAAIHRAINLALQLKATSSHTLEVSATTSTVELFDDLEPLDDVRLPVYHMISHANLDLSYSYTYNSHHTTGRQLYSIHPMMVTLSWPHFQAWNKSGSCD